MLLSTFVCLQLKTIDSRVICRVLRPWANPQFSHLPSENKNTCLWNFPGGSLVKAPCFHYRAHGFYLWSGTKAPSPTWCGKKKKNLSHGTTLRIKEDNRLKSLVQISSHSSDHYYFILCQPLICFYNSCLNFPYLHLKGIKKDSPPPEFPTFSRIMQELLGTKVMRNDPFISLLVLFPKGIIIQSISKDLHTKTWICLKIMLTLSFSQRKTLVFSEKSKTRNFICSPNSAIAKCIEKKTAWK